MKELNKMLFVYRLFVLCKCLFVLCKCHANLLQTSLAVTTGAISANSGSLWFYNHHLAIDVNFHCVVSPALFNILSFFFWTKKGENEGKSAHLKIQRGNEWRFFIYVFEGLRKRFVNHSFSPKVVAYRWTQTALEDTLATEETLFSKVFSMREVGFQVVVYLPSSIVYLVLLSLLTLPEFSRA